MSAPLDVLAVMDQAIAKLGVNWPNTEADMVSARAAIAELIEAAKVLDNKAMQRTKLTASVYTSHVMRLRAAIAAVSPK